LMLYTIINIILFKYRKYIWTTKNFSSLHDQSDIAKVGY
jgi:hypothetical protein